MSPTRKGNPMLNRTLFTALLALLAFALSSAHAMAAPSGAVVFSRVSEDSRTYEKADGEKFVKEPEGGLFAARSGRLNQLTEDPADAEPSFSADGRMVAFVRGGDVIAMRADGSGQRTLTSGGEVDSRPVFSSNGRFVVFERRSAAGATRDLYAVGSGGGNLRVLVESPHDDHSVTFSADGRTIAFVRSDAAASDDVYSVRPSGTGLRRLTRTGRIDEFAPRFSAIGIAYSRGESDPGPQAYADVYVMRANGREQRELVAGAGSSHIEDVTPNGRLLLFRRDQGLWVKALPLKGERRARKLIELPDKSQANAVFSSDGREVAAFVATETTTETRQTLTAISVATRRQRQLADGFSSSFGEATTTVGSVMAWQPVPGRR
jgi:Tol biopolymer transport system component